MLITNWRERLRQPRVFFGLLIGLVVVAWGGYLLARGGWVALKNRQAAQMTEMSRDFAGEGKWQEAAMSAHTALRLDPTQPDATRFMAGMMEGEGRWGQAMELYGRLYQSGGGSLGDLKKQAINAARGEYTDPARFLASEVAKKGEPEFPLVLEAEILLRKGDVEGARRLLREALSLHDSRSARAAMLRFLVTHPGDNDGAQLRELVLALKDGDDEIALEALALGLSGGLASGDSRADFIAALRAHPMRTERQLLLADVAEVAIDPASKPRVLENLLARLKGGTANDRLVAAMWLNGQGQPREALELLTPKDAIATPAAMRVWLDSAAALGEWGAMLDVLARKELPLPPHMVRVYTARALKMDGRPDEGDAVYSAALEEFRDNPRETAQVLEYLHRSGENALFDEGLKPQLAKPGVAMGLLADLMPALLDSRDSARLREVLSMAVASPHLADAPPLLNDLAYLDLVLGMPVDVGVLQERFRASPNDPAALFNLALASLRNNNPRGALAIVEKAGLDYRNLAPNHLTVLACVLAANGRTEDAVRIATGIPATRISGQELNLLRSFLEKGKE
jgi:tetratricopeptide (TPR) repeat protein